MVGMSRIRKPTRVVDGSRYDIRCEGNGKCKGQRKNESTLSISGISPASHHPLNRKSTSNEVACCEKVIESSITKSALAMLPVFQDDTASLVSDICRFASRQLHSSSAKSSHDPHISNFPFAFLYSQSQTRMHA